MIPSAAGKPGTRFGGKVGNQARFLLAQHLCQRPKRGLGGRTSGDGVVFGDAGGADQRHGAASTGLGQVDQRKGQVARIGSERLDRLPANLLPGPGLGGLGGQVAQ